jgi:hypothetical protein
MVEQKVVFEWSHETVLALSSRFCSWNIPENEDEYALSSAGGTSQTGKYRTASKMN